MPRIAVKFCWIFSKESASSTIPIMKSGEVAEWLKAAVSKIAILSNQDRGFESHPLRHLKREVHRAESPRPILNSNQIFFFLSKVRTDQ